MHPLKILIGDDHTLVRLGFRKILEDHPDWTVVAEVDDGREAVRRTLEEKPDVAILDVTMPVLNGIDAARQIIRKAPDTAVLMLSMHSGEAYVIQALQAGVRGYLLKDSADTDLIAAVEAVATGKSFFSPAVASIMREEYVRHLSDKGASDRYDLLSEREREVFQLAAEGRTNKQIADLLCISALTVETHRAHIFQKLDIHNTAELVLYAAKRGVV
jgi:two-component system, NarL family, response regulator NreC